MSTKVYGYIHRDTNVKIYLRVPYHHRREAKARGAHWDPIRKLWYVLSTEAFNACQPWKTDISAEQKAWLYDKVRLAKYERTS